MPHSPVLHLSALRACCIALPPLQKSDDVATQEVVLLLPAACLLIPTTVKLEDYQKLVSSPAQPFYDEKSTITVPAGSSATEVINSIGSVFRAYVVQQTSKATILFARSFQGHNVTALLRPSDANIAMTMKSTCAGHASAMTRDVIAIVSPGDMPAVVPPPALPPVSTEGAAASAPASASPAVTPAEPAESAEVPSVMEFVPPPPGTRTYLRDPSVSIDDIDPMADDSGAGQAAAVSEDFLKDDDDDAPASAGGAGADGDDDAPIGIARVAVVKGEEDEEDD